MSEIELYDLVTEVHAAFDENASARELGESIAKLHEIKMRLIQSGSQYVETVAQVALFVGNQRAAHLARMAGKIVTARRLETECDRIYGNLPNAWKW